MMIFNISGLSRQEQPTSAQLHLHMMTSAVINITIDQEELIRRQPKGTKNETEVRISLESLLFNNSQWTNDTLTIKVASTDPIILPTHHHYHPGLLIYMGGDPLAIDDFLATPLDKSAHSINDNKERQKLEKKDIGKWCRLKSFKVMFSEVGHGYQHIIQPESLDIGQCVGKCPQYLGHPHNPTKHTQIWNLLALDFKVSCAVRSFKPTPIVLCNHQSSLITYETYNELVATSRECSHCSS